MVKFIDNRSGAVVETDNPARIRAFRRQARRWTEDYELDVPTGTVAEILAWVGDDLDRRTAALRAERAGKQRKGILDALS